MIRIYSNTASTNPLRSNIEEAVIDSPIEFIKMKLEQVGVVRPPPIRPKGKPPWADSIRKDPETATRSRSKKSMELCHNKIQEAAMKDWQAEYKETNKGRTLKEIDGKTESSTKLK